MYRFSSSRLCIRFAPFLWGSSSPRCLFAKALTPKISKKDTLDRQRKRAPRDHHFFVVVRYVFIMWYTRARESLSLFSISTKGRSPSSSRLSLDRRVRVLVFIARKELERLLFYSRFFLRARPKKSPKLSSASCDPSFFITTRFQKSGSLFGSMREREREEIIFIFRRRRSAIYRSFVRFARFSFSLTNSLYINNFEKQAPFERSISRPWTKSEFLFQKEVFE